MITFNLNGERITFDDDPEMNLLTYLRNHKKLTAAKDGCSGQGVCGACTVEINGKTRPACRTKMNSLDAASVVTMEGLPESVRTALAASFAEKGAVQCGFCTPGMIMRARNLLDQGSTPSREEITRAINPNLCRCTGYVKIIDAIEHASAKLRDGQSGSQTPASAKIGDPWPKYQAIQTAKGERPFVDDMHFEGMVHGALKFSDHPRAVIKSIDTSRAEKLDGVIRVLTAGDIPGKRYTGLIFKDWPLMLKTGERSHCIADVLATVIAKDEATARKALSLIEVDYEVEAPVTDMMVAMESNAPQVHPGQSNVLENCVVRRGDTERALKNSAYSVSNTFETQRIEHAFLETETAIALPEEVGVKLFSQGQGVYIDRREVARILGLDESLARIIQVQNGGGFGGKEDLTVQGHAALAAFILNMPVKFHLNREESIRMHPKRHPVRMEMTLGCDEQGKFTALKLRAYGDTGAFASVGTKVMERIAGHAAGGYDIPNIDLNAVTIYTNNLPSGAMRGFGVPQVVFAIESCIDEICRQAGFDRWQIRYDNALRDNYKTCTGQKLKGVGLRKTLLAVKDQFYAAKHAGIACGIKNTGVGNGMIDESTVSIRIESESRVILHHGWSEMGQGVHNMAIQTLHEETGIDPDIIEVVVDTGAGLPTGMTTSSRATALVGNAVINAASALREDLKNSSLKDLAGRNYRGAFVCDWTTKPGERDKEPVTHFAYGYATQLVILNEKGEIEKVVAAHDAGRIMNRMLFEGQIQGAVHMGLGYALTEDLPLKGGIPESYLLKDTGILRAKEMPEVEVIGIEEADPVGPYGAKGIGEIGMVPTAAAVATAMTAYDGKLRTRLPLKRGSNG